MKIPKEAVRLQSGDNVMVSWMRAGWQSSCSAGTSTEAADPAAHPFVGCLTACEQPLEFTAQSTVKPVSLNLRRCRAKLSHLPAGALV